MTILIIGCTGRVGGNVMMGLSNHGMSVRCMSRSADKIRSLPAGVEGRIADLAKPETLPTVLEGVEGVFLLNAVGPEETKQGLAAVQAAKAVRIEKIVYLSVYMPEGYGSNPLPATKLINGLQVDHSPLFYAFRSLYLINT